MTYTTDQFTEMSQLLQEVKSEIGRFIVGQESAVEFSLYAILADGHALLEGLPGLGKTMLIRTISDVLDLSFSRIQFTPDLMPSDITGTSLIERDTQGRQQFTFREGPIFHQMVLADEINRATPKTQSALLEAMGEKTVTILGDTKKMARPFFVLATQNPIEMEGTYPLPEAQMDRFLCKILVAYPSRNELAEISRRTTGSQTINLNKKMNTTSLIDAQDMVKEVLMAEDILMVAVDMIQSTHPEHSEHEAIQQYVQYGSGPRGLQSLIRLAKARALMEGRYHVSIGDLKHVAKPVLRHRLLLNYEAEAMGKNADELIDSVLSAAGKGVLK
ncbi:protein moxR [Planococcus antarcticus DSM 14505]|uniref:AAA family ATPase n=1 Tax=Planococcus antarcticus DSM 14505 TaxID=1185653 RepID=A0A1C7DG18_9BACL|nr:AAA family ATPase [Planococcus antarcticus]ANU10405.1 AAA family ATPase [Planococcus antarcticus DSM 14505]EIM05440.1 protein moxR [Planococcus antarcticus DSM 14505]